MNEPDPFQFQLHTPVEVQRELASRIRTLRLMAGLKQSTLAARAGMSLSSLRHFEQHGEISLKNLLRLCLALGRLSELDGLLRPQPAATMAELEVRASAQRRERGSK